MLLPKLFLSVAPHRLHKLTVWPGVRSLHTILDSDVIFVMDKGRLVEGGAPDVLLENEGGFFARLVAQARLKRESVVAAASMRRSSRPALYRHDTLRFPDGK